MIAAWLLLELAVAATSSGHESNAGDLPVCGNRVIVSVVKRAGCTLGDARCWLRRGGFCTDHVETMLSIRPSKLGASLTPVVPAEVQRGDVAVFASRAHYAFVEKVTLDRHGRPVAVDLSELNFGTCWVDRTLMITDQYGLVGRRVGVPLGDVDGGFLRARRAAR